ncbi:MAG: tetratricopeptide repeat protein [Rubrivivax sp.]|nr:tetratricopeptide repeat protein [Rubrivivax sp.]
MSAASPPTHPLTQAQLALQQGRPADALIPLEALHRQGRRSASSSLLAANARWVLGQADGALEDLAAAVALEPSNPSAHLYRGLLLKERGRPGEALASLDRVLALVPGQPVALLNKGAVLQSLARLDEARRCYEGVLKAEPANALPHAYLGLLDAHAGDTAAARRRYERALSLDPQCAVAHDLLSRLALASGDFATGWAHYEWRFAHRPDAWARALQGQPAWAGQADARLLVVGEQGVGDQILHATLLAELAQRVRIERVLLPAKLLPLMQRAHPQLAFGDLADPSPPTGWSHVLRLGSLGRWLRPDPAAFADQPVATLQDDPARTQALRQRPELRGPRVVGLSWRSAQPEVGREKSMGLLEMVQALQPLPGVSFVNLQYGAVADEIEQVRRELGVTVHAVPGVDPFDDLDSLASLMRCCHAVVSTSSSTAHLAGALGADTWLLVPAGYGRLWYWHEHGGRCLWYPSVRVLAQSRQGQWDEPLASARAALDETLP